MFFEYEGAQNFMEKLKTHIGGLMRFDGYFEIEVAIDSNNRGSGSFSHTSFVKSENNCTVFGI